MGVSHRASRGFLMRISGLGDRNCQLIPQVPFERCEETGKRIWPDRETAERILAVWAEQGSLVPTSRPYDCPFCGGVHLTHEPPRRA